MKVGIVGCGRIAQVHLTNLRSIPEVEVVGLCDTYLPAAGSLAERFGIPHVYRSIEDLLSEAQPQVVHVLTPPETHASVALSALAGGAHLFVEKPMATSLPDAEAMVSAAGKRGLILCVDHNRLLDPVVVKARELIQQGIIGEVVSVETYQGFNRGEVGKGNGNGSLGSSRGAFYNLAVHPVYLQLSFLREVRDLAVVSQITGRFPSAFAEELRVLMQGENILGYICFSLDIQPYLNALNIYGTKGSLFIDLNTMTLVRRIPSRLPQLLAKSWGNVSEALQLLSATTGNAFSVLSGRLSLYPGIGNTIRSFYTSLKEGTTPPVSPEEGREVVRLLEEIRLQTEKNDLQVADLPRTTERPLR